jgi:hypothetical protein
LRQAFYDYFFIFWSVIYPPTPRSPLLIVIVKDPQVQSLARTHVGPSFCIRAYELYPGWTQLHTPIEPYAHVCPPHECMPMPIFISPHDPSPGPRGAL